MNNWHWSFLLVLMDVSIAASAAEPSKRPLNLLFIITDQQRWDAMSCAGNKVLKTPNLDKLAEDGARFTNFYSACPVCVPARTSILTGYTPGSNRIVSNTDIESANIPKDMISFDQILLRSGYRGEYHGKYHSPYRLTLEYTEPVLWLNGKKAPLGSKATTSEADAYRTYLKANVPQRELQPGELLQSVGIYKPIPLDENFGKANPSKGSQAESYGRADHAAEHSLTAFTARAGLAALDRLKGGPFTLTISIGPPHPPMIVADPYYSMYPPQSIPLTASLNDPQTNCPYRDRSNALAAAYRNPDNIRQMTSIYYGMVTEVDEWVGKILKKLDDLGIADNTLVIFTADHGEMLGDHGMHGKFVFLEGSVHIPLLVRLPGLVPPQTVVNAPASHIDLFPTILDYLNRPGHPSEGQSLRPLIDGKEKGTGRIAVSEWPNKRLPGFMIFDGRRKLLYGRGPDSPSLDALYDLQTDPHEMNNLIGNNPDREKSKIETSQMKNLLVDWLAKIKSPALESVKARPILVESPPKPQ